MTVKTDNYLIHYNEVVQRLDWYKRPANRKAIVICGIITTITLIVFSLISAYASSYPLSSLGTIGKTLLGSSSLMDCAISCFSGSAMVFSTLMIYLYNTKRPFYVANYIQQNKGILFAIQDQSHQTKAYLLGTIHFMTPDWVGLSPELENRIKSCKKIYLERCLQEESLERLNHVNNGVDVKVHLFGNRNNIPVKGFETLDELHQRESILNRLHQSTNKKSGSISALRDWFDRLWVAWLTGDIHDAQELSSHLSSQLNNQDPSECEIQDLMLNKRNAAWMPQIERELETEDNPIFIAVGLDHLHDDSYFQQKGLISRLLEKGWSAVQL